MLCNKYSKNPKLLEDSNIEFQELILDELSKEFKENFAYDCYGNWITKEKVLSFDNLENAINNIAKSPFIYEILVIE